MFGRLIQNNVEGKYVINDEVNEFVIIEGLSEQDIQNKVDKLFNKRANGYDDFCECCGSRWSRVADDYMTQLKGGMHEVKDFNPPYGKENCVIHYADGRKQEVIWKGY